MPSFLDMLTTAQAPGSATTATATQQTAPEWYTSMVRDMASRGMAAASTPYTPYAGARVAGFSPLQQAGFQMVQNTAGGYQPYLDQASGALGRASAQLSGPNATWNTTNRNAYMSPYTSGVVNEIARLGNRNFAENIVPRVQSNFIGAGQFGSTRMADAMGRAARDVQADITGRQAGALESGYSTAMGQFNADQNRLLQGNMNVGQQFGALGQVSQNLGLNGSGALLAAGGQQQQQQQRGLDTAYGDFQQAQGHDMTQLNNLRTLISGLQLPMGSSSVSNAPVGGYGASPLAWLQAILNGG